MKSEMSEDKNCIQFYCEAWLGVAYIDDTGTPITNSMSSDYIEGEDICRECFEKSIVYFELNNWAIDDFYPNIEPITTWIENYQDLKFLQDDWVRENKLCITVTLIDMSLNFCISAKKDWVLQNCPKLLDYKKFMRYPDENGNIKGDFGGSFRPYSKRNIGIIYEDEDGIIEYPTIQ